MEKVYYTYVGEHERKQSLEECRPDLTDRLSHQATGGERDVPRGAWEG